MRTHCFVINQNRGHHDVRSLVTLALPGETDGGTDSTISQHLKEALGRLKLPFRPWFNYTSFHSTDGLYAIADASEVVRVIGDYPGAESVTLEMRVELKQPYFLPRDLATGEFIALKDQVQCLDALLHFNDADKPEVIEWFSKKRAELANCNMGLLGAKTLGDERVSSLLNFSWPKRNKV